MRWAMGTVPVSHFRELNREFSWKEWAKPQNPLPRSSFFSLFFLLVFLLSSLLNFVRPFSSSFPFSTFCPFSFFISCFPSNLSYFFLYLFLCFFLSFRLQTGTCPLLHDDSLTASIAVTVRVSITSAGEWVSWEMDDRQPATWRNKNEVKYQGQRASGISAVGRWRTYVTGLKPLTDSLFRSNEASWWHRRLSISWVES